MRHYQLGVELLHQGRPDRAARELELAAEGDPDNAVVLYSLGLAYYGLGDAARAERTLQRVLALDPYFSDARNSLGILYAEQRQNLKAIAEFERAVADRRYLTPEVPRFNLARVLVAEGRLEESLLYFRSALERKPDQVGWRHQYGVALEQLGRFDEARRELERALEGAPQNVETLYHLGFVAMKLQDRARARECFTKVLELAPGTLLATQSSAFLKDLSS